MLYDAKGGRLDDSCLQNNDVFKFRAGSQSVLRWGKMGN
jgi:hypothetical protein